MTSSQSNRHRLGVLDLQGGTQEHLEHFRRVGVDAIPVKDARRFAELAGLVIPGGESTCLRRLINQFDLADPLRAAHADGMKVWGTCAGAILIANDIVGEKPLFQFIDISIARNAFGSQLDSFQHTADIPAVAAEPVKMTFIRAPKILRAGNDVRVLLKLDDYIAAAENDQALVTVFHPELTSGTAFHAYFARQCGLTPAPTPASDDTWSPNAWMRARRA
ncbi:MAG: pyridoxal 5'-phosphate synthase glutaminase subunit PdxT [Lentisphaeria bacterium]|nr:pyridoxal 5'-phosphate synthase glutaminase subunit PdxT [Lentisphaeria bacterium]